MANPNKKTKRVAAEGKALLVAPRKVTSATTAGVEYKVGADGLVEVQAEHAAALVDHGFAEIESDSDAEGESAPATE